MQIKPWLAAAGVAVAIWWVSTLDGRTAATAIAFFLFGSILTLGATSMMSGTIGSNAKRLAEREKSLTTREKAVTLRESNIDRLIYSRANEIAKNLYGTWVARTKAEQELEAARSAPVVEQPVFAAPKFAFREEDL